MTFSGILWAGRFFLNNKHPWKGIFFHTPTNKKKHPGPFCVAVQTFFGAYARKDYVGALEDLDLALQIEPTNPFPQCCRAEADSCSCMAFFFF